MDPRQLCRSNRNPHIVRAALVVLLATASGVPALPARQAVAAQSAVHVRAGVPATAVATAFVSLLATGQFGHAAGYLDSTMAAAASAAELQRVWTMLTTQVGAFDRELATRVEQTGDLETVVVTCAFARATVDIRVTLDRIHKISGLYFAPGQASPVPSAARDQSFRSGADRLYGTLLLPMHAGHHRLPAVLLLAGSGPTDRDGNSSLLFGRIDTLRNFAQALAHQGVASLRYDKLGTGHTGIASHPRGYAPDFAIYVNEAHAAYSYLRSRPEIDPHRVLILGHSEGALIALVLCAQLLRHAEPRALVLAAPPGQPILETIRRQIAASYARAQRAGQVTPRAAAAALAEVDRIIARLKATGTLPSHITTPQLAQLFTPAVATLLAQEERANPTVLAAQLPAALPVLILHGGKDQQVSTDDAQRVFAALRRARQRPVVLTELPNVDHVFKEVPGTPNPEVDYTNPALRFSLAAVTQLAAFVQAHL